MGRSPVGRPQVESRSHCSHMLLVRVRLRPAQVQCGWGLPKSVNTGRCDSLEPLGNSLPPHPSNRQKGRGRTRPKARGTCYLGLWPFDELSLKPCSDFLWARKEPGHVNTLSCKGVWETECFHLRTLSSPQNPEFSGREKGSTALSRPLAESSVEVSGAWGWGD